VPSESPSDESPSRRFARGVRSSRQDESCIADAQGNCRIEDRHSAQRSATGGETQRGRTIPCSDRDHACRAGCPGAFFVVRAFAGPDAWSPWLGAGMCLAAGVLIAFSGFS